ncbi:hypothetical protein [Curtobacterium sp. Leaf261]|uniref:hypothetical protein n=1 Tax=Curtobacterium sp. Leaf261 TaxID=1736311 RepID=UPI00070220C1|nr:hypothetical protein [Curtobacterium sp. Leaf261]KQO62209.1 hypothetical protein ASF23_10330 [Curtobacterium sp. Leaf261]
MDTSPTPQSLVLSIRHDGRVLFELLADWYTALDVTEVDAHDTERISATIRYWAAQRTWTATHRGTARSAHGTGYNRTVVVVISARPGIAFRRFSTAPDAMAARFAAVFGAGPLDPTSQEVADLARTIAADTRQFFRRSQRRAEVRIAGGQYLAIMEGYIAEMRAMTDMRDQDFAYESVRAGIGAIMDDEDYLLLAEDERARALYGEFLDQQSELYNWHMDIAKGGVVRPR